MGTELVNQGATLGYQMQGVSRLEMDISHQKDINAKLEKNQPDIIINAAAYTAVDKAESEIDLAYAINCDGVANLAQFCSANKIPLLHISTDYVFDGEKLGSYTEADSPNPKNVYGKSKLEGECVLESILKQHIILRTSWVFSAIGNNFVKSMLGLAEKHDSIKIVEDQKGAPTSASAIAKSLITIVNYWEKNKTIQWGTYHFTSEPSTTWKEFAANTFNQAEAIGLISKIPTINSITTAEYPAAATRPLNSILNCQKINQNFGITRPKWQVDLKTVLAKLNED